MKTVSRTIYLSVALVLSFSAARAMHDEPHPTKKRFVEVTETIKLVVPSSGKQVRLWIPIPREDRYQTAELLEIRSPWPSRQTRDADNGNAMLFIESTPSPPPVVEVVVRYRVARTEQEAAPDGPGAQQPAVVEALPRSYVEPHGLIIVDETVRQMARRATLGIDDPLRKARALYDFVLGYVSYDKTGTGWGRGDVAYVCQARKGNCTDFHSLFIALCRASGIPARFAMGFSLPKDGGTLPGYHCWAEFFVAGRGWIPVDISEAWKDRGKVEYFFGRLDADRVLLTAGREIRLWPPQNSSPLNFFDRPHVEIDGEPLERYDFARAFKNVTETNQP